MSLPPLYSSRHDASPGEAADPDAAPDTAPRHGAGGRCRALAGRPYEQ